MNPDFFSEDYSTCIDWISVIPLPCGKKLAISGYSCAKDVTLLDEKKIQSIVSIGDDSDRLVDHPEKCIRQLVLSDSPSSNMTQHFVSTCVFIKKALDENPDAPVLVHCYMGISRSCTIVCAYLILEYGMSLGDALDLIRKHRPICSPNTGFMEQLRLWKHFLHPEKETPINTPKKPWSAIL
jgi:atypical dual specificity phosphatase